MLALTLAEVDEAALQAMCAERRGETSTLEWKERLPDANDRQKHELAKDVAGLANLDGGDLVFGIAEGAAQAERLAPISGETADAAERRIRQVLDSAIEPKIVGIDVRPIPVSGGFVLVVRVPSSFDGPHAVWVNSSRRFVVRNGTLVSDMSYEQIRSAFDRNATLREQGRQFRAERLALIEAGRTPVPLVREGPIAVLHVLPMSGLARRQTLDVPGLLNGPRFTNLLRRPRLGAVSLSKRLNLEGGVAYMPRAEDESPAYIQLFKTGAWEAVFVTGRRRELRDGQPQAAIFTTLLVDHFRNGLLDALEQLQQSGFSGPAAVGISLMRAKDYGLATNDAFHPMTDPGVSVSTPSQFVLPETWVEHMDNASIDEVMRPMLDSLWNAFNLSRCDYFDSATGVWLPKYG